MPSGSRYGKLIKSCFRAPPLWLFWGADFNALEEKVGTILSDDPNRKKVYTDGYDGHCLRAFRYFGEAMLDITEEWNAATTEAERVQIINSIEMRYPKLRRKSKAPTFALQYQGTWYTLMTRAGFSEEEAKAIEKAYNEMYAVSIAFAKKNVEFAIKHGYVELAFGLRLRTPVLERTVGDIENLPYMAQEEGRSANNAVTQSWGMLINRTAIAFDDTLYASAYREDIILSNTIHDALYGLVRNEGNAVKFLNDNLIHEMEWNAHPLIFSTEVPMGATLEIGHSWDKLNKLSNRASMEEVKKFLQEI
jgi:DNA polymerase-1